MNKIIGKGYHIVIRKANLGKFLYYFRRLSQKDSDKILNIWCVMIKFRESHIENWEFFRY